MTVAVLDSALMEETLVSIYALCDPDTGEVRYVGKAVDTERRLKQHFREAKSGDQSYKNRWLRTLLVSGRKPEVQILEQVDPADWQEAEQRHIAYWRERSCLTNSTVGGDGVHWDVKSWAALDESKRQKLLKGLDTRSERFGAKSPISKLNDEKVLQIRELASNMTYAELSERFDVAVPTLQAVLFGKTWKHVGGPILNGRKVTKVTDEAKTEIRQRYLDGESTKVLALEFDIAIQHVRYLLKDVKRPRRLMTSGDVEEIQRRFMDGETQASIARSLGFSSTSVCRATGMAKQTDEQKES